MYSDGLALTQLSRDECLALMASVPVGRIIYTRRALPAVELVNFTLDHGDIVIRTDRSGKLAAAARGAVVAFEADQLDLAGQTGWSVTGSPVASTWPDREWPAGSTKAADRVRAVAVGVGDREPSSPRPATPARPDRRRRARRPPGDVGQHRAGRGARQQPGGDLGAGLDPALLAAGRLV
jgi:hypothetical protein